MKLLLTTLLAMAVLTTGAFGLDVDKHHWPLRDVESFDLKSETVGIKYRIFVALPHQYTDPDSTFPVIYNLDSDVTFGMMTDSSRMLRFGSEIPATIVVGIAYGESLDNWAANRTRDLTPTATEDRKDGGGAREFLTFIKDELIPIIDEHYRTKPDDRTLSGASFAGLFTLYALLEEPGLFQRYLAAVPSVGYDNNVLFSIEEEYAKNHTDLPAKVFITAEGSEDEIWALKSWSMIWEFNYRLRTHEYPSLRLHTEIYNGETHAQAQPRSFMTGLLYLFAEE